jgi:uncharacterized protein (DUF1330 family)
MSAYLMNCVRMRHGIPCHEGLARVKRTVEAYGGRWHAESGALELHGAQSNVLVLIEFGSMTDAQNWYNSSEYTNISRLYVENAIDLALADGVAPDFTMAGFGQIGDRHWGS